MTLSELADKIEALEWPSREVDEEIWTTLYPPQDLTEEEIEELAAKSLAETGSFFFGNVVYPKPAYTADFNAAMSLVPEGHDVDLQIREKFFHVLIERRSDDAEFIKMNAPTPALALCAAALRARGGGE